MAIKILGGTAKGISLASPVSELTRPTSVMLKRKIFDANQNLNGFTFIDLCAGVGSVGLEAASRDASAVILVEKNPKTFNILLKNKTLVSQRCHECKFEVQKKDIIKWLNSYFQSYASLNDDQKKQVIIFFDPPYDQVNLYHSLGSLIKQMGFQGLLWVEGCRQKGLKEEDLTSHFCHYSKIYQQGTSYIAVCDFR